MADGDGGAAIAGLVNGGPADDAGLQEGDVITAVNGRSVRSASSLTTVMLSLKPGDKVSVTYLDQLGSNTASVTLGQRPAAVARPFRERARLTGRARSFIVAVVERSTTY